MDNHRHSLTGTEAFVKAAIQGSLIDLLYMDMERIMLLRADIYQPCYCCQGAGIHIEQGRIEEGEYQGFMILRSRDCYTCRGLGEIPTACAN